METVDIKSPKVIDDVVGLLKAGGVVALPSDTAYALCADASNKLAVNKIFVIKNRPSEKHLPVFMSSLDEVGEYVILPKIAQKLATRFWPGQLTLILQERGIRHLETVAEDSTIAVRVPDSKFLLEVVKKLGQPITSTSANRSGDESCYSVEEIKRSLGENFSLIDLAVIEDDAACSRRPVSTIVRAIGNNIDIIREGALKREEIERAIMI